MTVSWRKELAADANATWLVGCEEDRVHVLAPPGVSVSRRMELERGIRHRNCGWRWAVWNHRSDAEWPLIDEDLPDAVRDVDTAQVLGLLDEELREPVWECLWEQLQIARGIGRRARNRRHDEELAWAAASSEAWLSAELRRGFPDRALV